MIDLYTLLVRYIEDNKSNNYISYRETIKYLKELVKNIEDEYKEIGLL